MTIFSNLDKICAKTGFLILSCYDEGGAMKISLKIVIFIGYLSSKGFCCMSKNGLFSDFFGH